MRPEKCSFKGEFSILISGKCYTPKTVHLANCGFNFVDSGKKNTRKEKNFVTLINKKR